MFILEKYTSVDIDLYGPINGQNLSRVSQGIDWVMSKGPP